MIYLILYLIIYIYITHKWYIYIYIPDIYPSIKTTQYHYVIAVIVIRSIMTLTLPLLIITTSITRLSCPEEHGINMTSDKGNVDQAPQSGGAKDTTDVPTCAFWDEELAIWSTEGVSTLPSTTPGKALLVMVCAFLRITSWRGVRQNKMQ